NALLVQPLAPKTYWGFQYAVGIVGKGAPHPPLGFATLAAVLPKEWELRIADLNVAPLRDADLRWADVVLITGMLVHKASMHEVIARARKLGVRTVVGGPGASTRPEEFADADHVFTGEAEGRLEALVAALERGKGPHILSPPGDAKPDMSLARVPRFDLLARSRYTSMSVQYSRGCPFQCEFCDIIELYGRNPRTKTPQQVLEELDALYALGWRGSVFVVDDNFIGNRKEAAKLLPEVARWQREHGRPFELYTEASVDLASLPALVESMVDAGFATVFLGIETPSAESLKLTRKLQNLKLPLQESVMRLTHAGLEVYAGFIVGFDTDGEHIFEVQREFISGLPIAAAMIGLLTALPNTALWRRLEKEGRLRTDATGDQFGRPNFDPALEERTLLEGYRELLATLYDPAAFYARCERLVAEIGPAHSRTLTLRNVAMFLRILVGLGLRSPRRRHFWRLLYKAARRPQAFAKAMSLAVVGEHLIRYTREDVLPRIDRALEDLAVERRRAPRQAVAEPAFMSP
ncbi:MAG: B12-binding domain-containing radical SAM protein, partial [Myxococcales bacterium]